MRNVPLREFRRIDHAGDDRITINLAYVISVAPSPTLPDQTVIRITTGRGFVECVVRGGYDQTRATISGPSADEDGPAT